MSQLWLGILFLVVGKQLYAQEIRASELLERAITHHDPNNEWPSFRAKLQIELHTPEKKKRLSTVAIDLQNQYFELASEKEGTVLRYVLDKGVCSLSLNGKSTFSKVEKEGHQLSCERATLMRNYYTYLYGLPMKLRDAGTRIAPKVHWKTLKGKRFLALKVTYDDTVGDDTWYFYFDPKTYALEAYQFFHDEGKNDGEYILLTGVEEIGSIKIPKTRAWYYNKNNGYLGTDKLIHTEVLN